MKRVLALILTVVMLVGLLPTSATAVTGWTAPALNISLSSPTVSVGDDVTATITLTSYTNLGAFDFDLLYDKDKLEYKSHATAGVLTDPAASTLVATSNPGVVTAIFSRATGVDSAATQTILTITFTAKAAGSTAVAFDPDMLSFTSAALESVYTNSGVNSAPLTIVDSGAPILATAVSIDQGETATISVGESLALTATVSPPNSTDTVGWSSGNTAAATVNASTGVVTGVAAGTAVVTATASPTSLTDSITVTVDANRVPRLKATSSPTATASCTVGNSYKPNPLITTLFEDPDGNTLSYYASVDGGAFEEILGGAQYYEYYPATAGTHTVVIKAYDGKAFSTDAFTATVNVNDGTAPYDMTIRVAPSTASIQLYPCTGFDANGKDTYGAEITLTDGGVVSNYHVYTVSLSKGTYSFRGKDAVGNSLGGMTFVVPAKTTGNTGATETDIYLRQTNFNCSFKVGDDYLLADDFSIVAQDGDGHYATLGASFVNGTTTTYPAMLFAGGNAMMYNYFCVPSAEIAAQGYTQQVYTTQTVGVATSVNSRAVAPAVGVNAVVNAPAAATVQVFNQLRNFNAIEVPQSSETDKGDGTVDHLYVLPKSNGNHTYRVSMDGKITKAGFFNLSNEANAKATVSFGTSENPKERPVYDKTNSTFKMVEDSILLNVNSRNFLTLGVGDAFKLRAYRAAWEIVNTVTANIMIEPDFHYNILAGDDVISLTPVDAGSGNAKHNWANIRALKEGVAIVEVTYDAIDIGGNTSMGGRYGAIDPLRKGIVIVKVGGSSAVTTGIDWESEFDTLYFDGEKGSHSFTPESGATVSVATGDMSDWTPYTADAAGKVTIDIAQGNNIVRVERGGSEAYQVIRGKKVIVKVKGMVAGDKLETGDTIQVSFDGLYMPVPKFSGIYNPGFGNTIKTSYTMAISGETGTTVAASKGTQYDFISNHTISIPATKAGTYTLTGGYIPMDMMCDVTDPWGQHRRLTDEGVPPNFSAGRLSNSFCILPDVQFTVQEFAITDDLNQLQSAYYDYGPAVGRYFTATYTATEGNPIPTENVYIIPSSTPTNSTLSYLFYPKNANVTMTYKQYRGDQPAVRTGTVLPGVALPINYSYVNANHENYLELTVTPNQYVEDNPATHPKTYVFLFVKSADYTAVDAAIAAANALTAGNYTNFDAVTSAIGAVVRGKYITAQTAVDAMAQAIDNAVAALTLKDADYSAVDAAISAANALTASNYVDFSAVTSAIGAVVRGKKIDEQAAVDAMATAINGAVSALVLKGADYTAVDAAISAANALTASNYSNFGAVTAAINAVVRGKKITEQAQVDAMAQAIDNAMAALVLKGADYSGVDAAIEAADAMVASNYENFSAVTAAIDAVVRGKKITEQGEVDAMALAINQALVNLVLKPADYTAVDAAIGRANALNAADYVDFSAVTNAVGAVVRGKKISEQAVVNAMAQAIDNAIANLVTWQSAMNDAIAAAEAKLSGVLTSADGTDVYDYQKWATSAQIQALDTAITLARAKANPTQADVAELTAATNAFSPQAGEKSSYTGGGGAPVVTPAPTPLPAGMVRQATIGRSAIGLRVVNETATGQSFGAFTQTLTKNKKGEITMTLELQDGEAFTSRFLSLDGDAIATLLSNKVTNLRIVVGGAVINIPVKSLQAAAIQNIAKKAGGTLKNSTILISLEPVAEDELTAQQQAALGKKAQNSQVYRLSVKLKTGSKVTDITNRVSGLSLRLTAEETHRKNRLCLLGARSLSALRTTASGSGYVATVKAAGLYVITR